MEPYLRLLRRSHVIPTPRVLDAWPSTPSFDVVFSSNVIEHIADDQAVVHDMARALRPGGRLVIYVPAFGRLFGPMDDRCGHLRRYTTADLARLVHTAGLQVLAQGYADPLGGLITWLFNGLGRGVTASAASVGFYDRWLFPVSRAMHGLTRTWFGKNAWIVAVVSQEPDPH